MSKGKLILLSLLSGLLLSASWPHYGFTPLIFIAFVPLLYVEQQVSGNGNRFTGLFFLGCSYLTFLTWNLLSTWWVWNASPGGAIMAITANALFMALVFYLSHTVKKKLFSNRFPVLSKILVIPLWITFEYLHHNWDLSYPWLTLGNGFAKEYKWVQWYEYTGIFGGSLWILLVNILVFDWFTMFTTSERDVKFRGKALRKIFVITGFIGLPLIISYKIYNNYEEEISPVNVVIVQPNIDPYSEKFNSPYQEQLNKMLSLAETQIDSSTDFIVFPETAITENIWENQLESTGSVMDLKMFLKKYPWLKILTGASTAYQYQAGEKHSPTAKKFRYDNIYYEDYNTALQIDTSGIQKYHKSKLVPGVEKMPFPTLFKPLEKLAIDMGGTSGSLCGQDERTVFISRNRQHSSVKESIPAGSDSFHVAPVICYESIYGEYVGDYINNGAGLIFIITNDGWWGDTPGYKQHLFYGRLRAIEVRRSIVRSANTGISCFINQKGDILQPTQWWEPAAIKSTVNSNYERSFYTTYGDYIARIAVWLSLAIIMGYLLFRFRLIKKL